MENDSNLRESAIQEIIIKLQAIGNELQQDTGVSAEDKMVKMDVFLDVLHFLCDYEENVKVLNKYWLERRKAEKYASKFNNFPEDR